MPIWRLSDAAAVDIVQIYETGMERFGEAQADSYNEGLERAFAFFAEFPRAARQRDELSPSVRAYPYKAHLIFYEIGPDGRIRILRVRNAREDWQNS